MLNEMIVTISKGQQITIPASMRELLGLDIGSKVDVECEEGKIIINPVGEELEVIFKAAKNCVFIYKPCNIIYMPIGIISNYPFL